MLDKTFGIVSPLFPDNFLLKELQEPVFKGQTRSEGWRRLQLDRIEVMLEVHESEILNALEQDLGKPPTEAFFELIALRQELKLAQTHLKSWMRPRRVKVPISLSPGEAFIKLEPFGCVLIISPWNYPLSLTIQPLISVLAAGNTAVLKPSEHSSATSELINKMFIKYFPKEVVQVFLGGSDVASKLLEQPFDHIVFTGSSEVGKKVMQAASKHLTPVTLELGGKSPAIVLEGADIAVTAKRLIWGKSLNAGQTCIAPDHLFLQEKLYTPLIEEMKRALTNFYGANPLKSPELSKIINNYHFKRLKSLLEQAQNKGQILCGGDIDESQRRISPALINVEDREDPLMEEELFGPLFPIIRFADLNKLLSEIRQQPKPLALYMFGGTKAEQQKVLNTTSSGGVCFNDVIMQAGIPELPFGGVGKSGIGRYHGLAGFEAFSHQKSIFKRPFWLDLKFRYPPYKLNLSMLRKLLN